MRSEDKTDRELLEAVLDGQKNLAAQFEGVKTRLDRMEGQLQRLTQSQDILVKEIHQNKVDIDLLKNTQAS